MYYECLNWLTISFHRIAILANIITDLILLRLHMVLRFRRDLHVFPVSRFNNTTIPMFQIQKGFKAGPVNNIKTEKIKHKKCFSLGETKQNTAERWLIRVLENKISPKKNSFRRKKTVPATKE